MDLSAPDLFSQHPELKHLRRALQLCKGFGLYFVSCNTVPLRNELVAALKANLATPIIELPLTPENDIFIDAQMAALLAAASADAIVFIYDLEKLYHLKDRHVIQELNWRREIYGKANHPVVFWMPDFLLTEIFNEAPDFADWRSGLYEFHLSQPEQLGLMHSTWESAGENFVGQLSLTEKERWIVNLENLLAELAGQEASKTKGDLLCRLGGLYSSIGKYELALRCYQQSLQIQQEIGDTQGKGDTLNNASQVYKLKGDYDTALLYLMQSLQIQQDNGDRQSESMLFNNISQIYVAKGDYDTALQYLMQSLQIWRQDSGNKQGGGATLNNIAQIYNIKGDYDMASQYLKQSLQICQDIGDKQGEGSTHNNIAQVYCAKGVYDTALLHLMQSLKICQDIGDKQGEGLTLNNISQIHDAQGDYATTLHYLSLSLKIQQDIGDKAGEATTLNNLSQVYIAYGDYETSLQYLTQSLQISQAIGDKATECAVLFNIGLIHQKHDEQPQALSTWLKAYHIAKQIGWAEALQNLDKLAKDLGHEGLAWWETLNLADSAE
jgi:tetratricopeptide (TPR) repeat protein